MIPIKIKKHFKTQKFILDFIKIYKFIINFKNYFYGYLNIC